MVVESACTMVHIEIHVVVERAAVAVVCSVVRMVDSDMVVVPGQYVCFQLPGSPQQQVVYHHQRVNQQLEVVSEAVY